MERLDTLHVVETPEGVELHLRPAGPLVRGIALLVDQALLWAGLFMAAMILGLLGPAGGGLWLILLFLAQWLYPVLMEVLGGGRTVGKRALGLRVLRVDGLPVGWGPSLLRNLLRVVDALPFGYTVGLISVMMSRHFQRIGDLAAGTLVVHEPESRRAPVMPEVPAHPVPTHLTVEEQGALLAFAERSGGLNPARAQEIADLLEGLTGSTGEEGVRRLQGMARHIRGMA